MTDKLKFQRNAQHLRKVTGSTELEHALRKVVKVLAQHGVPHLVGGDPPCRSAAMHGSPRI
jgi:hypothetical protein